MAEILEFKSTHDPNSVSNSQGDQTADVIIFPGIRVDREKFSLADRLKPSVSADALARRRQPKTSD